MPCDRCGAEAVASCDRCGGQFCAEHAAPPAHDCFGLALAGERQPAPGEGRSLVASVVDPIPGPARAAAAVAVVVAALLAVAAVWAGLGGTLPGAADAGGDGAGAGGDGTPTPAAFDRAETERLVAAYVTRRREDRGVAPVDRVAALDRAAAEHAAAMLEADAGHARATPEASHLAVGCPVAEVTVRTAYGRAVADDGRPATADGDGATDRYDTPWELARGAVDLALADDAGRRVLLDPDHRALGVGVRRGPDGNVAVTVLFCPESPRAASPTSTPAPPPLVSAPPSLIHPSPPVSARAPPASARAPVPTSPLYAADGLVRSGDHFHFHSALGSGYRGSGPPLRT